MRNSRGTIIVVFLKLPLEQDPDQKKKMRLNPIDNTERGAGGGDKALIGRSEQQSTLSYNVG